MVVNESIMSTGVNVERWVVLKQNYGSLATATNWTISMKLTSQNNTQWYTVCNNLALNYNFPPSLS